MNVAGLSQGPGDHSISWHNGARLFVDMPLSAIIIVDMESAFNLVMDSKEDMMLTVTEKAAEVLKDLHKKQQGPSGFRVLVQPG